MLDLKLALYLPLCRLLGPGVMVTCADDIETYCLDLTSTDTEALAGADVVALGHPSSLAVGAGHGVYVLVGGGAAAAARGGGGSVHECLEVLQKPSVTAMRHSGAVFRRGRRERRGGGGGRGRTKENTHLNQKKEEEEEEEEEEEVWSDSVFWLGADVTSRLLKWYTENRPLDRELDAYAHILPCLGKRTGHGGRSGGMGQEQKGLQSGVGQDFRPELTPILRGAKFKVIALPKSKFYHLGTMGEYLGNYNMARDFVFELGIVRMTGRVGEAVEVCVSSSGGGGGSCGGMSGLVRKEKKEEEERKEEKKKKQKEEEEEEMEKEREEEAEMERKGRNGRKKKEEEEEESEMKKNEKEKMKKLKKKEEEEEEEDKGAKQARQVPPPPHPPLNPPQGTIIESYFTNGTKLYLTKPCIPYVIEQCHIALPLRLSGSAILSNCAILPCANLPPSTTLPLPPGTLFHTVPVRKMSRSFYVTVAFDVDAKMKDFGSDLKDVRAFGRTLEDYAHVLGLSGKDVRGGSPTVSLWNARIFRSAPTAHESFATTLVGVWKVKGGSEGFLRVNQGSKGDFQGCEGVQRVKEGCEGVERVEKGWEGREWEEKKGWERKEEEEEEERERYKRQKEEEEEERKTRKKLAVEKDEEKKEEEEEEEEEGKRNRREKRKGEREGIGRTKEKKKEEEEEEGRKHRREKRKEGREEDIGRRTEEKKKKEEEEEEEEELFSMSDVVKFKDLEKLLDDRKKLIALMRE
ncbi:uncharacterized protein LOC127010143 isoform X2 [Eriocheir sinensis]|nr:uncharacterized protein LOC127010143 isoform X2 [Eriocheir sinensis]